MNQTKPYHKAEFVFCLKTLKALWKSTADDREYFKRQLAIKRQFFADNTIQDPNHPHDPSKRVIKPL